MKDERLTEGQIEQILAAFEERLGKGAAQDDSVPMGVAGPRGCQANKQTQQAPAYEKQLHIWVTEEDKNWFYNVARSKKLKSGAFISYLRSLHDAQQLVAQL